MGIFDGPIFDFNGDGETDAFEFAMGMSILEEMENEEAQQNEDGFAADGDDGSSYDD